MYADIHNEQSCKGYSGLTSGLKLVQTLIINIKAITDQLQRKQFDIVNFLFLDGDVSRSTSYGVYISHLIRFARVFSHVTDLNALNKILTGKLHQGYRYHKFRKTFSKN